MFDGSDISIKDAARMYPKLWHWSLEYLRYLEVDAGFHDKMTYFGKKLLKTKNKKVVVLGHTHGPEIHQKNDGDPVYVNAGFNCTDFPALSRSENPRHMTFVEVEVMDNNQLKVSLKQINYNSDPSAATISDFDGSPKLVDI